MIKTKELFDEAISLPVDIRTRLIHELLLSLHPVQKETDCLWAQEAEKRVEEIRNCRVTPITAEEVFQSIRDRPKS